MSSLVKGVKAAVAGVSLFGLAGCGTLVPQINEAWEGRDVDSKLAYSIKKSIFCETVEAIDEVNRRIKIKFPNKKLTPVIPDDYGVQMQTTLTIEESTSLNPSVGYNSILSNGRAAGAAVGQSFNLGFGGTASSTATRTDTAFTYWVVGKVAHGKEYNFCHATDPDNAIDRTGNSPLVRSDIGIKDYLISSVEGADILHSSAPGKSKSAKLDIYSYDIKFAVVTSASVNPTWKLVASTGGGGTPFLGAGRTRTHELLLTFGPNGPNGFEPSLTALNQHLASQIKSSLERP